ncbi:MAG: hypothetical protein E7345_01220 [Clostridiales bacterium]|nr:hypothetical protein [Clostridiales bacterium]
MSRLKLKIKPLFILYVFLCIYFGWYNEIFYYVIAVLLHEYGHYYVGKMKGYDFKNISFNVYGAGLYGDGCFTRKDDILISLAGPCVNLILIILTICFWWLIPSLYYYSKAFVVCNLIVMVFNLLPIYPLDGGRILVAILSSKVNKNKLIKAGNVLCIILGILFLIAFLVSIFYIINFNFLFIGLFMMLNGFSCDTSIYKEKISSLSKSTGTPLEVKTFVVKGEIEKIQLVKYLSPHYYSVFEIKNKGEFIKITEDELLNM